MVLHPRIKREYRLFSQIIWEAPYHLSKSQSYGGQDEMSNFAHPGCISPGVHFSVESTSTAVDNGVSLDDVPEDIDGVPRPQGTYIRYWCL